MNSIVLSKLGHTWILDLDGTLVKHNGYLENGCDSWLNGAKEFLQSIPEKDCIILLTSRDSKYSTATEEFLNKNNIRYDHIIFEVPYGERILINDSKPSGLIMSYSIDTHRDEWCGLTFVEDESL